MNKHFLLGSAAMLSLGLSAQSNGKLAAMKFATPFNAGKAVAQRYNLIEPAQTISPIVNAPTQKNKNKTTSVNSASVWNLIGGSSNMYGVLFSSQKPLQYDPNTNCLSFIHRKSANYTAAPTSNSGAIIAEINHPFGSSTWDSTCVWSDASNLARYPQGAIFGVGTSSLGNAYIAASGPVTDGTNWKGSFFGSKQLNAFNNTASATPNAMQVFSNSSPFAPTGMKGDMARNYFTVTNDGKIHIAGEVAANVNNTTSNAGYGLTGFIVYRGIFSAGTFTFASDTFNYRSIVRKATDSSYNFSAQPYMAWNDAGTVGYVMGIGQSTFTGSVAGVNNGWQPIIYKTTNSGASWNTVTGIDFSTPTFSNVLYHLFPVNTNTNLIIPHFNDNEGIDVTVDANGKLHIFTSVVGMYSSHPDSAGYVATFSINTGGGHYWRHTTGEQPYLYDFVGDGSSAWNYMVVDSMSSEAPGSQSTNGGYSNNPWDVQNGAKLAAGARLQMSRDAAGNNIVYTWSESDTNATNLGVKWNYLPNLKARVAVTNGTSPTGFNVMGGSASSASLAGANKANLTGSDANTTSNAWFHFTSPRTVSPVVTGSITTFTVPATVSFNSGYTQLTNSMHWYAANVFTVAPVVTGINENNATPVSALSIYPNPAKNEAFVNVTLTNSSNLSVYVLNALGQIVKSNSLQGFAGANTLNVDLQGLNSGVYFVKVSDGNHASTTKLIVQ